MPLDPLLALADSRIWLSAEPANCLVEQSWWEKRMVNSHSFLAACTVWIIGPAVLPLSTVLNAYLKLELLQTTLHAVALSEPQPAPRGSTLLLFPLGRLVLLEFLLLLLTALRLLMCSQWSPQLLIARPGTYLCFARWRPC